MSTPILYDSLLVHYLARELHDRLAGRRLRGVRFDSDARRFILELDDGRLVWELHPTRGWIRTVRDPDPDADNAPSSGAISPTSGAMSPTSGASSPDRGAISPDRGAGSPDRGAGPSGDAAVEGWGGRKVRTQRRPRIRHIRAPLDERILEIQIDAGGPDRASRFVVELMSNQWNVLALDPAGTILSALWAREAGDRILRSGATYRPPGGLDPRDGIEEPVPLERFAEVVGGESPGKAAQRALVRTLAWTSSLNARAILEPLETAGPTGAPDPTEAPDPTDTPKRVAASAPALREAWERYRGLASRPAARPRVLEIRGGLPYPLPLPGIDDRPATSLLAAFEAASLRDAPAGLAPEVRTALEDRLERVRHKARSLREEAESAPEKATRLRSQADLLMARLRDVPRGATTVDLEDFEGGTRTLELDPSMSAVENAESMYDRAKKRERAAARLPARVRQAVLEQNRLESLLTALEAGTPDPDELARWVAEVRPTEGAGRADAERLPYRTFRSSGGLEIRVGRSGRANDELTFHHSAPDDIWLHARDTAGAHVILRWGDRAQNPPARDLMEAAMLAALNSKARTSGTVPVDWTRRKYVRSPRNAPPGAVIPDRVATIFVEPDPEAEGRLRN